MSDTEQHAEIQVPDHIYEVFSKSRCLYTRDGNCHEL